MRVSIACCALVAWTTVGLVGCSNTGGSPLTFSWNPFKPSSKEVASTPPKPSAFATPSPNQSDGAKLASTAGSTSATGSYAGLSTGYPDGLTSLSKGSKTIAADSSSNPYSTPQSGYYDPNGYAAVGTGNPVAAATSQQTSWESVGSSSVPPTTASAAWGVDATAPRYAPAAERYANPSSYGGSYDQSLASYDYRTTNPSGAAAPGPSGTYSSTGSAHGSSPYGYPASSVPAYGGSSATSYPQTATSYPQTAAATSAWAESNPSAPLPAAPVYGQTGTAFQPGQGSYQPGSTGYVPGATDYSPGNSNYAPGNNGYNPAGTTPYQSPAGQYQPPAEPYQSPTGQYQSPGGAYPAPGSLSGPLSHAGGEMPEFRPGSTKSLPPSKTLVSNASGSSTSGGANPAVSDQSVTPVGYTVDSTAGKQ